MTKFDKRCAKSNSLMFVECVEHKIVDLSVKLSPMISDEIHLTNRLLSFDAFFVCCSNLNIFLFIFFKVRQYG